MSADADSQNDAGTPKRRGILPLIFGLVLGLAGAGGAYWAVSFGPFAPQAEVEAAVSASPAVAPLAVAFVPLDRVTISLGPDSASRHLIFSAELEVPPEHAEFVTSLRPRILDVLNSYLRVVDAADLSNPSALGRIRAQMLHRVKIVTGEDKVRDLLITEFVVN
ncbi:MAG: flagellar basal body-associated FliL family protein [Pseudomonadota bacterium]